jgi:hypothetical protein
MIIGGRYITFGTVYGTPIYWILGATLGCGAVAAYKLALPPSFSASLGVAIELVFGAVLLMAKRSGA